MNGVGEQPEWSDADFDSMSWHDTHIHGFAALPDRFELQFDIDFILEWIPAASGSNSIQFRIAPATLTFHNVANIEIELSSAQGHFSISEVRRTKLTSVQDGGDIWTWLIECHEGHIGFEATGFHLILRRPPSRSERQYLATAIRGPLPFGS